MIEGVGTAFYSVQYQDMNGDGVVSIFDTTLIQYRLADMDNNTDDFE